MNIKSLLLGSAAALVAVSGARAADAVVAAEPEPMEYVRICDTYGTGFFYIPGTETCLKIGGYVRADISGGDVFDSPEDSYNSLGRLSLTFDARDETEYGTLRAFAEVRFTYSNGGNDVGNIVAATGDIDDPLTAENEAIEALDVQDTGTTLNFAYIELAGFRIGKGESAFTVFPGYAGNVIADDLIPYGPFDTLFAQYEADFGGGFSGIISVEEGSDSDELQTYVPHVVGGLKYDAGMFAIAGVAAYDANNEEFAAKVRVDVKASDQFYGFIMGGYKTDDGQDDVDQLGKDSDGTNYYGNWSGNNDDDGDDDGFAVWGGFSYVFTPAATLNTQVAYTEAEDFAANINLNFKPVPNLSIQPEVVYVDNFDDEEDGNFGGYLRFQRNF